MPRVGKFGWLWLGLLAFAIVERLHERRFSQQATRGEVLDFVVVRDVQRSLASKDWADRM
jgi:hypothetical protein